jgi:hypothetical protein
MPLLLACVNREHEGISFRFSVDPIRPLRFELRHVPLCGLRLAAANLEISSYLPGSAAAFFFCASTVQGGTMPFCRA